MYKIQLIQKVILYNLYYKKHIKTKHPEMCIRIMTEVLEEPEFIYKSSRKNDVLYFEKDLGQHTYRVVVGKYERGVKKVITAYRVENEEQFTRKHTYCVYDKKTFIQYEDIVGELESDIDYFYQAFNVEI